MWTMSALGTHGATLEPRPWRTLLAQLHLLLEAGDLAAAEHARQRLGRLLAAHVRRHVEVQLEWLALRLRAHTHALKCKSW